MKSTIKKTISMAAFFCLLAASLTGCGSETVTEVAQTDASSQQEIPQATPQESDEVTESPEMAYGRLRKQLWQTTSWTTAMLSRIKWEGIGGIL